MEWGETPEATAARELQEETGLTATIGSVIGVFSHWLAARDSVRGQAGQVLGVVFAATGLAGALRETFDPGTTDAARWFTIAEARDVPDVELVDFVLDLI